MSLFRSVGRLEKCDQRVEKSLELTIIRRKALTRPLMLADKESNLDFSLTHTHRNKATTLMSVTLAGFFALH